MHVLIEYKMNIIKVMPKNMFYHIYMFGHGFRMSFSASIKCFIPISIPILTLPMLRLLLSKAQG